MTPQEAVKKLLDDADKALCALVGCPQAARVRVLAEALFDTAVAQPEEGKK